MKPWYGNKLIWLNAASGGVAFMATAWGAASDSLPVPKWIVLLVGSVVAALNVGLHFVISDPEVERDIRDSERIGDNGPHDMHDDAHEDRHDGPR